MFDQSRDPRNVTDVTSVRCARSPIERRPLRRVASDVVEEVARMLNGEMARYQIADRIREAEADRRSRSTRRSRVADERGFTRRVTRAAIAAVVWPVRH
jgi:hypothetical protein